VYVDVTEHLESKIKAMEVYQSQIKPFPNERSVESLRALAALRGSAVGVRAAEAFVLIRQIY
jgi:LmbE family N-acetylglucosaminyl deacetylase